MRRPLFVLAVAALAASTLQAQSHGAATGAGAKDHGATPTAVHGPHWSYEGAEGPLAWGRLDPAWRVCATGHEQSPIDLGGAVRAHTARLEERFTATNIVLFNNGHTVQAALDRPSTLVAEGGRFDAVQFHFHHPSEHTVNGKAYPAEVHLVHKNAKGDLAVLGIFIEFSPQDNPAFDALVARLPKAEGDSVRFASPVDLATLLEDHPGEAEPIYTYHGSLTTPPCSEGVKWTVRARPMHASHRQMQRLVGVLGESARPVQPVYDRH